MAFKDKGLCANFRWLAVDVGYILAGIKSATEFHY